MARPKAPQKKARTTRTVASNRNARREYALSEMFEAGLVLTGTEVKSLRQGRANISDAYASAKDGEIWLWNADIPVFTHGNRYNHEPKRGRKLLLNARQIKKLIGELKVRGVTLIPLELYFGKSGYAKVTMAVAKGKQEFEKREDIKKREWKREQGRLLKKK